MEQISLDTIRNDYQEDEEANKALDKMLEQGIESFVKAFKSLQSWNKMSHGLRSILFDL